MEKLVHKQLGHFLENSQYLSKNQNGFRKDHSTTSATAKFVDDIMLNTAQNRPLFERQDRCSLFSVLCYFRYFVRE